MAFHARWQRSSHRSTRRWSPLGSLRWTLASARCRSISCLLLFSVILADASWGQLPSSSQLDETARREAVAAIPFDRLDASSQAKLRAVVDQPTIYRRLPVTVVDSDPDMYLFLIRYPEVVVNMWQLMGVTKVKVNRTGDYTLDAADGAGTSGQIELVYGDRESHIYYSEGAYEGPLFRRLIRGRCVLVLKSEYCQTMDQRMYVTNRLDMFVQLENIGAELLAKTLLPLVGKTADQNFIESSRFLSQVSIAAETKPEKLRGLAGRLENVDPQVRTQFVTLIRQVAGQTAAAGAPRLSRVAEGADATAGRLETLEPSTALEPSTSPEPGRRGLQLRR